MCSYKLIIFIGSDMNSHAPMHIHIYMHELPMDNFWLNDVDSIATWISVNLAKQNGLAYAE